MIRVETGAKTKFRTDAGVWIEKMITAPEGTETEVAPTDGGPAAPPIRGASTAENEAFRRRYGLDGARPQAPAPEVPPADQGGGGIPVPKKKGATNEVDTIDITFKAVTLAAVSPSANNELAYAVRNELRNDPMFDAEETDFPQGSALTSDEPPGVFTFRMNVKLKRPLKL